MESISCPACSGAAAATLLQHNKSVVDFVLIEQVLILIQDPAHIINSKFPAMA
jgi:hypothetical protein